MTTTEKCAKRSLAGHCRKKPISSVNPDDDKDFIPSVQKGRRINLVIIALWLCQKGPVDVVTCLMQKGERSHETK